MNHAELTMQIIELENIIESRRYNLKLAEQSFTFIFQTAKDGQSDEAKIRLADAYIEIANKKYVLENMTDKLKSFKKARNKLAA